VLLPSASTFLLLLCNDPEVLGPWVNPRWLNVLASVIIGVLIMLSGTLMATTLFPNINAVQVAIWLSVALAAGFAVIAVALQIMKRRSGMPAVPPPKVPREERSNWRMPPLALLKPVTWAPGTKVGMMCLRGYLLLAVVLLAIKAAQVGGG
jgi:hypothetical protein